MTQSIQDGTSELEDFQLSTMRNFTLATLIDQMSVIFPLSVIPGIKNQIATKLAEGNYNTQKANVFNQFSERLLSHYLSVEELKKFIYEIELCLDVQAFDYYLSRMLTKTLSQRPEILKASEYTIKASDLLQCADINEAILRIVEKKIQELGYLGLTDIIQYLKSNLKMNIDTESLTLKNISEMFEVRNIIVHNGGYVNERFLIKTKRKDLIAGEKFPLSEEYVSEMNRQLVSFAIELNQEFVSHFKLT